MSKITMATVKSFVKKAGDKLLVSTRSTFDGMTDCVMPTGDKTFAPAVASDHPYDSNLGLRGVWFVLGSRDYFSPYEDDKVTGIEVSNCCGSFILAVAK